MHSGVWHPEILRILLENGADVDARDDDERTPLFLASTFRFVEIVKYGTDVARTHPELPTESLRILLAAGANPHSRGNDGRTVLMVAASRGDVDTVQALLEAGADVNARDHFRRSPLAIVRARQQGTLVPLVGGLLFGSGFSKIMDSLHQEKRLDEVEAFLLTAGGQS